MSKICILSAVNIKHMAMISLYTERLLRDGIDFDIVYMDKYGEEEDFPATNKYVFKNIIDHEQPRWKKAIRYMRFRSYAINVLNKNQYDFIIVWNDVAIIMFADYLARKWRGKYALNIRDYCHQRFRPIYWMFSWVIRNSSFTTVSSLGFCEFLPPSDYIQVHSLNMPVLRKLSPRDSFRAVDQPIRIGFVGYVRFIEINSRLLDIFKNDPRFELHYYGAHSEYLQEYAIDNGIHNACFHGAFPVQDTNVYMDKIDVVNNLYGNQSLALDYALSIKLYNGVWCRLPILVCPGTYMEKIADEYKIGYTVHSYDDDLKDRVYEWYRNLDFDIFNDNCERFIATVEKENQAFENAYQHHIASIR